MLTLPDCCYPGPDASPAERAYCAYNAAGDPATAGLNFRGDPCPTWASLPANIRAKWEGAVRPIVLANLPGTETWVDASSPDVPTEVWATATGRVTPGSERTKAIELIDLINAEAARVGAVGVKVLTRLTALPLVTGEVDVFTDVAFPLPDGTYHKPEVSPTFIKE